MGLWTSALETWRKRMPSLERLKLDACPLNKTKDCLRPFLYSVLFPALSNQGKNKHKAKTPGGGKNPGDYPLHHIFG